MQRWRVSGEARLGPRNRLTLPDLVIEAGGLTEGDRFVAEIDRSVPDTLRLHRMRASYAGALRDVYGEPADALAEVRQGWE